MSAVIAGTSCVPVYGPPLTGKAPRAHPDVLRAGPSPCELRDRLG